MSKVKLFTGLIALMLIMSVGASAQTVLFISSNVPLTTGDKAIADTLEAWGYGIVPAAAGDIAFMLPEEFEAYDLMAASESINSGDLNSVKTIPLPLLNLEGWCVKPGALDWQTDRDVNNYPPEPVKIVDETGHPLAAGFNAGDEFSLTKPTTEEIFIVGSVPQIPIIPIAAMSSDETKLVIYGIEAGTQNAVGDTMVNRVATIGLHAFSYDGFLTDEALKLIKAGADWLTGGTAVEGKEQFAPTQFELAQNYPNPFNPTTQIQYTLGKNTKVEIAVYDLLGHKVATLMNGYQNAGSHKVVWDASGASAGVYMCQMKTNNVVETKKMLLVK